ncbi:MAG TPA: MBL fold metallo-hydrolase [Rhodanobacteraceae bacterium]|nr:MBL fold metallo-hydrolase [Rhodanobacteraceae bacterium]
MKLWSIEGNTQKLDGGAMFGNAPKAMWQKWIPADEANRIPLACRCLLATDLDGRNVLFETGIGAFFEPKLRERYGVVEERHVLLESLAAVGLKHEDIDVVVLSHLHFDHVGGLLAAWEPAQAPPSSGPSDHLLPPAGEGKSARPAAAGAQTGAPLRLLFPKAQYVVGALHWERATHPHPRDRASFIPGVAELLEQSGRLEKVEGEHSRTLGKAVRFHYSQGHTPGLMLSEIVGPHGKDGMVYCADLIPGTPWVHLPVTMGYDRAPEMLIDEKRGFLDDKLQRGVRLFFTHDHAVAMASPRRDERGRYGVADVQAHFAGVAL